MIARTGNIGVVTLVLMLAAACGSDAGMASTTSTTSATSAPEGIETTASVASTIVPPASTIVPPASTGPTEQAAEFPIATFAAISEEPVTEELAAKLQVALDDLAGSGAFTEEGGMVATVMTADGSWSGTVGTADGVRDLQVDDQFAIASITKSVVAAQVMLMVEAGELGLDDLATDHLPADFQFDTNGATIRHLLSHRSGIPDDYSAMFGTLQSDPLRVWMPADVLERLPTSRGVAGRSFEYSGANYLLLGLVIEHVRGRPVAEVLREGVLAIDGMERLVSQPAEKPTEPMAMPGGESTAALETGGGYLPSLAATSAFPAAGGIASDSPSLARWWRVFCAGEIVSQATLTEMSAFDPDVSPFDGGYGLGSNNPAYGHARAVGHGGELFGYMSWAACLPEEGAVIVLLSNRPFHAISFTLLVGTLRPFIDVLRSG
jgi:D-alanyl-D-alanine carboxypeptidase